LRVREFSLLAKSSALPLWLVSGDEGAEEYVGKDQVGFW
jgi:hypothetical protein